MTKKEAEDMLNRHRKEAFWDFFWFFKWILFTSSWCNSISCNPLFCIYTTFTTLVRYFKI